MFPQGPKLTPYGCDQIYSKDEAANQYPEAMILDFDLDCWTEGINEIDQDRFETYARLLLDWCDASGRRVIFISHDGTITHYRLLLGETGLTREDFLGEAGIYIGKMKQRKD